MIKSDDYLDPLGGIKQLCSNFNEQTFEYLIGGQVDRAMANETVDQVLISGRAKPNTMKIGIHNFPA